MHKLLTENASTGKLSTKTQAMRASSFLAAVLAYTKLELLKTNCGLGHFRLQAQRYAIGLKAMH